MRMRVFGSILSILAIITCYVAWAGFREDQHDHDHGPATPNPSAGFHLGNPARIVTRVADGPVSIYVAPEFLNWGPMPDLRYRFVASAMPHGGDRFQAIGPAEGAIRIQPAGQNSDPDHPDVEMIPIQLPPGTWKVFVAMHDLDLPYLGPELDPGTPPAHMPIINGRALQIKTLTVEVR